MGEIMTIKQWLKDNWINIDYINSNPDVVNTEYGDFSRKPYFNIIIDDKAGFEPETDWWRFEAELKSIGQW
jgi:hypothetical protein